MIYTKRADELQVGDVLSTDGYVVRSAVALHDGRISIEAWLDASGGISKRAALSANFPVHVYVRDGDRTA